MKTWKQINEEFNNRLNDLSIKCDLLYDVYCRSEKLEDYKAYHESEEAKKLLKMEWNKAREDFFAK